MDKPPPQPTTSLLTAIGRLLAENGAMTAGALAAALQEEGLDLGPKPEAMVTDELFDEEEGALAPLADQRWVHRPALLAGRVFTHRLTSKEVDHDVLNINPDLEPIVALDEIPDYQRLVDGCPVTVILRGVDDDVIAERQIPDEVVDEYGALLLPPGYIKRPVCSSRRIPGWTRSSLSGWSALRTPRPSRRCWRRRRTRWSPTR